MDHRDHERPPSVRADPPSARRPRRAVEHEELLPVRAGTGGARRSRRALARRPRRRPPVWLGEASGLRLYGGLAGLAGVLVLWVGVLGALRSEDTAAEPERQPPPRRAELGESPPPRPRAPRAHRPGEWFRVGDIACAASRSWWADSVGGFYGPANAAYLLVEVGLRNEGRGPALAPSFQLVDRLGREYESHWSSIEVELARLNPGVGMRGTVAFDVPAGREYRLRASTGILWFRESALVQLEPR